MRRSKGRSDRRIVVVQKIDAKGSEIARRGAIA
jgi:hypothetical protein